MLNPKRNNSCSKSSKQKYIMSASYSKKKKAPKINIHSLLYKPAQLWSGMRIENTFNFWHVMAETG